MPGAGGWEGAEGLMGTEVLFVMMKEFWRQAVELVTQQSE